MKKTIITALVLAIVLAGAYFGYGYLSERYTPEQAEPVAEPIRMEVPDFTVSDSQGNPVTLSERVGNKPILLHFWATWCGPCCKELPGLNEAAKEYGEKIDFMMVDLADGQRETVQKAITFLITNQYTFPAYFDTEYEAATAYGVSAIPMTVLIDAEGREIARVTGAMPEETLREYLKTLAGE